MCVCVCIYTSLGRGQTFVYLACGLLELLVLVFLSSSTPLLLLRSCCCCCPFFSTFKYFPSSSFRGPCCVFFTLSLLVQGNLNLNRASVQTRRTSSLCTLKRGNVSNSRELVSLSLLIIRRFWARKWSPWRALFHKGGYRLPNVKIHSIRKWCEIIYMRTQTIFERKNPFLFFFVFFSLPLTSSHLQVDRNWILVSRFYSTKCAYK